LQSKQDKMELKITREDKKIMQRALKNGNIMICKGREGEVKGYFLMWNLAAPKKQVRKLGQK